MEPNTEFSSNTKQIMMELKDYDYETNNSDLVDASIVFSPQVVLEDATLW